ncbi:MAG: hypothetical protein CMJ78_02480 [Planctomycetaceae bacterium]|nr:hypothetical protein [Planctomycetaceae bacterium]
MPRRRKPEFLQVLYDLFRLTPIWVGPVVAACSYGLIRWGVPALFEPAFPEEAANRTFNHIVSNLAPMVAPYVGGLVLFVWLFALFDKISNWKSLENDKQRFD